MADVSFPASSSSSSSSSCSPSASPSSFALKLHKPIHSCSSSSDPPLPVGSLHCGFFHPSRPTASTCIPMASPLQKQDATLLHIPDAYDDYNDSLTAECRICQEEEEIGNLEKPCACSGSIKYAHRKCVQRWCDEKGDTVCEICQETFRSGYTAPPSQNVEIAIDLSDDYGAELQAAMAAAQRRFLDAHYEEANSSSAACCRSAALILMALLLLRHAIAMATFTIRTDEDASMFFTLFLLRAVGFVLPCYIMARAMNMIQRRHHRQGVSMAAAEVAFLLQAGQSPHILSIAPGQPQVTTTSLHSS